MANFVKAGGGVTTLTTKFTVKAPTGYDPRQTRPVSPDCFPLGQAGAGMTIHVVMAPTDVSLYRAQIMEVGGPPSGASGYFLPPPEGNGAPDHGDPQHANQWYDLGYDNAWKTDDHATSGTIPAPWTTRNWSGGGFTWNIPVKWKVGAGPTHDLTTWSQQFALDASGTVTVTKFGHQATRPVTTNCSSFE